MKIAISNNRAELGKIEQGDREAWRTFNGSFHNIDIEPKRFMELVQMGYAYTSQHTKYRKEENFLLAQHLGLDMDTKDERSTLATLSQNPFIAQYALFIHTTPSHTEEAPKARVVFCLDRPIKDSEKYKEVMRALVDKFSSSDSSCKDASRFFYGAKGCSTIWLGNIITLEDVASELVMPFREKKVANLAKLQNAIPTKIATHKDVPSGLLVAHSYSLLERVKNAQDGEKHLILRNVSNTFGGYVAGGYYKRHDVVSWLQNAIRCNPHNVKDLHAADETIEEGVTFGESKPLYYELRDNTPVSQLDSIHPPLTQSQKEQLKTVVKRLENDAYWQGYHNGMTHAQRAEWYKFGMNDQLINHLKLGYLPKKVDGETGEISESALVVPYIGLDGKVTNVEYRYQDGSYSYENTIETPLYYVPDILPQDHSGILLWEDSLTAVSAYLQFGNIADGKYQFAALPHAALHDAPEGEFTVIISPDSKGNDLRPLKGKSRFLRLPLPVDTMIKHGVTTQQLEGYLRQAKRW